MSYFDLVGTACAFALYSWKEERLVRKKYYGDALFRRADKALKKRYRWRNPYAISRRFLKRRGADEIHTYGETPLTTLEQIAWKMGVSEKDVFLDLGCGRGRGVFFVHCRFGCRAIGLDWISEFIEEAQATALKSACPVDFQDGDMAGHEAIERASVIFLAWTCMDEKEREAAERALERSGAGTRIATVSYPLSSKNFILKASATASFPWGEGEVFFHERKNGALG